MKAGATRISRDVIDETTGQPATLYLNVLASAEPRLAEKVDPVEEGRAAPRSPAG